MTERSNFRWKVIYLVCIAVLLYPLSLLSQPRTVSEPGGVLAQVRDANDLGQADLGDIDPASETMKLATVGLRGVAVQLLWNNANEYKKTENWSKLTATLDVLAKLQPNFITFWKFQSWNQSYNLSVEFDDYRDRYYYVRRGIEFLEEGQSYNRDNPQLLWELGWFVGQKIGRADEKIQYRRLFKADDEYHGDRPAERRDNWLVSKDWYNESVRAADVVGRGIGRKSPLVFYSSSGKSQINYSEAIGEDGLFGRTEAAWKLGESDWRDFGAREIEHSTGVRLRLNEEAELQRVVDEAQAEIEALADEAVESLQKEKRAALTDEQREALDTPAEERTDDQRTLAYQAKTALKFTPPELAAQIGKLNPDAQRTAERMAAETVELERRLRYTKAYKQTSNYDYWLTRTQFEQTEDALEARSLVFAGKQAFKEELDPVKAKAFYARAFVKWRKVLDEFPVLLDGDGTTGDDLVYIVRDYDKVLEQLEENIPDDFPLWDVIEEFDIERHLEDELQAYKQRQLERSGGAVDVELAPSESAQSEPEPSAAETSEPETSEPEPADPDQPAAPAEAAPADAGAAE